MYPQIETSRIDKTNIIYFVMHQLARAPYEKGIFPLD